VKPRPSWRPFWTTLGIAVGAVLAIHALAIVAGFVVFVTRMNSYGSNK
jgi:hypothetical protein